MTDLIYPMEKGLKTEDHKSKSAINPLQIMPLSPYLILPIYSRYSQSIKVLVRVNSMVKKGELLYQDDTPLGVTMHAPTSGKVIAIKPYETAYDFLTPIQSIILETDGKDETVPVEQNIALSYKQIPKEKLLNQIHQAGIVGLGGAGYPSALKMLKAFEHSVKTLIINAAECEPYITADDKLMQERSDAIKLGIEIVTHLVNPQHVVIGIEDNKPLAIQAMKTTFAKTAIQIKEIPTCYPSGDATQLIKILIGKIIPANKRSVELGVLCHNVGTFAAIGHWAKTGLPLLSRITTITGSAVPKPCNIESSIGTPIADIFNYLNVESNFDEVMIGGQFMNHPLHSTKAPINKVTNCIIANKHLSLSKKM